MGFRCGIVGLPNVGKSTLFNALTRSAVASENYPFCTIDPNVGVVAVPDPRLDAIAAIARPAKVIAATMEFVDIAGLVQGAAQGEGLGNRFLAHIREVDAIAHVVRGFEDGNVTHVAGRVDPASDMATIDTELALADLETVERAHARADKATRIGDKEAIALKALLERVREHLNDGRAVRTLDLDDEACAALRPLCLLTAKPVLFLVNLAEGESPDSPGVEAVRRAAEGAEVVPIAARLEAEIAQLDETDRAEFLADMGLEEPGLNRLIRAGYRLLRLDTYFTAGPKEARAWTIRRGSTAPQAAGVIHSDFERGFIRAEVIAYEDYIRCNGEQGAKEAGRMRLEGRDYIMRDGDVVHFRFNV